MGYRMTNEEIRREAEFFRDTSLVPRVKRLCQEFLDRLADGSFPKPSRKRARAAYMKAYRQRKTVAKVKAPAVPIVIDDENISFLDD